jgi:RHS repeat-associated protein
MFYCIRQNGEDFFYLYDGKGNVTTVVDSSQAVVATYQYNAFGRLMHTTGTLDQTYQFSTKRYDAGTGLSYYGYRFYAPVIERWLNRDPLGEAGGINLYGFVGNDPVNGADPWGRLSLWDLVPFPKEIPFASDWIDPPALGNHDTIVCKLMLTDEDDNGKTCFYECPSSSVMGSWTTVSVGKCDDCPEAVWYDSNDYGPPIWPDL